ncbi:MAG: ribosome assembly cofactor RimP [Treponema sp.]|jgi:ribosome maturation factor RimP|nr:ribosome assembly cofactor RimP [Treponema sp.]
MQRYASKASVKENKELISLRESLEEVLKGLGFCLVELTVSRQRGSVQVRTVIYNGAASSVANSAAIGTEDCSKTHRAIMPRLELAFPESDIYLEVSSPGIDRLIKDSSEFIHYTGKGVRCYRTDISDWTAGVLESADEKGIVIKTKDGVMRLEFDIIAKAKLDSSLLKLAIKAPS